MCNTQILKYQIQNKKKHFMVELVTTAISLFSFVHNKQKNKYFKSEQQRFESRRIKEKKGKLTVEMLIFGVVQLLYKNTARLVPL